MNLPDDNPLLDELRGNAALMARIEGIRDLFQLDGDDHPEQWERVWLDDEREEIWAETRIRRNVMAERLISQAKIRSGGAFEPGDLVMLRDINVAKNKGMKLDYRWTGPFMIHVRTKGDSYVLRHMHDDSHLLYGHHHRDDLKLWTARPPELQYGPKDWFEPELPHNMRQYRKGLVTTLKGKV
ncbi:hypothetical protein EDC01DRAFT_637063 [Geopyxis carbonaria]|nr:hypothetical protein EDC01DRAFT_637063 [Geopyxis carbonaria]